MPTAWQVREYQRQQLIEKLFNGELFALEDKYDDHDIYFVVAHQLIKLLSGRLSGYSATLPVYINDYIAGVIVEVNSFSRTAAEKDFLIAKLLEKVIEQAVQPFHAEKLREEVHEPEKVFDGHEAMDEIPLPDEE